MNGYLTKEEKLEMKKRGMIEQKQEGYYVIRLLSDIGYFTSSEMIEIVNIASRYGNGEISLTSRLTIEIPYIKEDDIKEVVTYAKEKGLRVGGAGNTIRAIVSCKGTVCKYGLIDTRRLSKIVENQFLGRKLPGKFKIGVYGCVNSHGKAQSNDLSLMPIKSNKDDENLFLIFIGGRLGKKARLATPMKEKFKESQVLDVMEVVVQFYRENAKEKERFAEIIERMGLEEVEATIMKQLY